MDQPPDSEGGGLVHCRKCGPKPKENFSPWHFTRPTQLCRACVNLQRRGKRQQSSTPAVAPPRILAIGDVHFPWHSEAWYAWMLDFAVKYQPTLIVQLGDLNDQFAFSRYPRSHNVMTPADEMSEARELGIQLWKDLQTAAPKAKCVQLRGNHDDRIHKRIAEKLPEMQSLVVSSINALYEFDGVRTIDDSRDEFMDDGVAFHHGHRKFGAHVTYNNMSTCNGHLHIGGVKFLETQAGTIWELNAGCGIDVTAPVFAYGAQKRLNGITLGLGAIDEYGPRFVPFKERR